LKTDLDQLQKNLNESEIETERIKGLPHALKLKERGNVFITEAFMNGWFEVQDASSQQVAKLLDPKPGMRVIDACAGAGGKCLHIASLMQNKGQVIALDIYDHKLKELKRRAKRNGAFNIETRLIQSTKTIKKLYDSADKVLIDAPCSGLGVLKRNPDSKWKLQPEFLDRIRKLQSELLDSYSKMVRSKGQLLYATCSILPSENEMQIKKFLKGDAGSSFKLIKEEHLWPSDTGYDGFYMALLQKNR
jgi:16S rRNA (cytosine967-C5)-methyltransferase